MPGAQGGGQAGWHAERGWIFVACDHLGVGDSSLADPAVLGIGQSMGGCLTVVQQARHESYDGVGVLGYSAIHT